MIYREEVRDLFSIGEEYYLAQCISADFGMGKGIAVEFNRRYDMRNKLINKYNSFLMYWDTPDGKYQGTCILEDKVFNLITKRNYWLKPTYETISRALMHMKIIAMSNNVNKIAMPLIGCGLDRLDWNNVSKIIQNVFSDTNIEILICKQ